MHELILGDHQAGQRLTPDPGLVLQVYVKGLWLCLLTLM